DENYLCNLCGNNSHDGYDCQQQFPFVYEQEPSYNQNYDDNYYPHESLSYPCCDYCGGSHETFQCQPDNQNVDFFGFDQIQTPQYPDVNPPSPEISNEEIFQAKGDLMTSIQNFLERFNCIPSEEKPQILFQTWETFFAIQCYQPEDSNELFQKLLKDLKELAEYDQSTSTGCPIFLNNNKDHHVQNRESPENSSKENVEPPQDSNIHQLIEECSVEVPEEQKQKIEDTMFDLVKICRHKQFLCIHDDIDNLIESALDSKLLSINSIKSQLWGYEHLSITPETESDEVTESNAKNLLPIPSEYEVTSEDKKECNELVCDNHSDTFSDSKIDDDISVYDDDFKDIKYVDAAVPDPAIVSVEEENVVHQEEEEVDLADISQVQDVVLHEKLFSTTCLISNIESLNDNSTPDCVFNSFESEVDLFLFDNSIPPGIENVADDPEGDIRFLEELLIDDSILSDESSDANFKDNQLILRPPPEPPDDNFDLEPRIYVRFPRPSYPLIDFSLGNSISVIYIAKSLFVPPLCSKF
nr:hypothetical protein [Tanacetum cinerariifolium]